MRPSKPPTPQTSVYLNDVNLIWYAPSDDPFVDFGATTDGYKVEILQADGVWYEDTGNCDGMDQATAIALKCTLTMTIL